MMSQTNILRFAMETCMIKANFYKNYRVEAITIQ